MAEQALVGSAEQALVGSAEQALVGSAEQALVGSAEQALVDRRSAKQAQALWATVKVVEWLAQYGLAQ